jgi:glycosyltransferase involved in cell wall biosynthesis
MAQSVSSNDDTDSSAVITRRAPELSIGMPVYNGEKYLRATLDSLLAQTASDFELIVSDNCSTDQTRTICEEYAERDTRMRYILQRDNIGGPRNWNFVAEQARGRFFKWASSNDFYDPRFLERCLSVLRASPDVVLCYTDTILVDEAGAAIAVYDDPVDLTDPEPLTRFKQYLLHYRLKMNNAQAGVIRADALKRTALEGIYPHGDIPLMAELSLHGRFIRLTEPLFFRRMAEDAATPKKSELAISRFVDPRVNRPVFWRWAQCLDLIGAAVRAPIGMDRLRAVSFVLRTMNWRRGELGKEFVDMCRRWLSLPI